MDSLPVELLKEILSYLVPNDKKSLPNCSLVAKPWSCHSQELLYESFHPLPGELGRCLDQISKGTDKPLRHVHHLTCETEGIPEAFPPILVSDILEPHSHSFERLTRITLLDCRVSRNAIVSLINWFPNLEYLNLERPRCLDSNDHEQTPLSSRRPLKRLWISEGREEFLRVLCGLPELEIFCFDEIAFKPAALGEPGVFTEFVNATLRVFGASTKYLRIPKTHPGMCNLPFYFIFLIPCAICRIPTAGIPWDPLDRGFGTLTLKPCRELRELEFEVGYFLRREGVAFISTITSTVIEKIIINSNSGVGDDDFWRSLDQILTELVGRQERKIRLEVQFHGNFPQELETRLPEFIKRGGVARDGSESVP